MARFFELVDYYFCRLNLLRCLVGHDMKNVYIRISIDGNYSGKNECQRCFEHEYFYGSFLIKEEGR
jgi:hypothetical protein